MSLRLLVFMLIGACALNQGLRGNTIDSLQRRLALAKKGETSALYNELSFAYRGQHPDSSMFFGKLARVASRNTKKQKAYLEALENIVIAYYILGQYDSSLAYVQEFIESKPTDWESKSIILNLKGLCLLRKGENRGAMDAFYASLREADKGNSVLFKVKPLTNIGLVYMELNQNREAIEQFQKVLILLNEEDNIGVRNVVLADLAACYGAIDALDSARYYAEISFQLALQIENPSSAANALNILSTYYQHMNDLDSAALMLVMAKPFREMQAEPYMLIADEINLAQIYLKQGKYTKAKGIAQHAQKLADRMKIRSKFRNLLLLMAQIAEAEENWKEASFYYARWGEEKDSIFQEANSEALAELQVRYSVAQQEKTNLELKTQQQGEIRKSEQKSLIILLILAVFAGIIGVGVLLLKRKQERDRIQSERREKEHNEGLFKAWIEGESKERTRLAKELHDGLGQLLVTAKMSLDQNDEPDDSVIHSKQLLGDSIDELRHISHDLMPVSLMRLGIIPALRDIQRQIEKASDIACFWELPETLELEAQQAHTLYRVTQECINNSLKHAQAKELHLQLRSNESGIHIRIWDDGKGFDPALIYQSKGLGWNSILLRIKLYDGSFDLESKPGNGTNIFIQLPFRSSK